MLHYRTVERATLDLLKSISGQPLFSNHRLVDGTALALRHGHRVSIDLDFFSTELMDQEELLQELKVLGKVELVSRSKFINSFFINEIKVDFVSLPYGWLESPVIED